MVNKNKSAKWRSDYLNVKYRNKTWWPRPQVWNKRTGSIPEITKENGFFKNNWALGSDVILTEK